ncbi:hydroxymethylbilane synthase [Rhizobium leguminosarum]|uniref:hydroxymethylbilane synthase n=1 Tax=Rhizobium leguminosarum TaxID=384 RepID=UPI0013B5CC4A|nr:hydroxymethylbilane synthase [Rhizobium leguminosarum]MCA2436668.1 hydroxymethylbilane synthase [Rhizobium leguminosarum]NEH73488.1 hydroxymethylbilane synthase [Rhizobium leguminosarum]
MRMRIATRGSKLAMWQAHHTKALIAERYPELSVEIVPIKTTGDKIVDRPLHELAGKSLFIKELEEALLNDEADLAVHCVKDYHPVTPGGFDLDVVMKRETAADLLLSHKPLSRWQELPAGAVIGTTSQRRIFELKRLRPDLQFRQLRGNIDTRLQRLQNREYDAIVLAESGFERLGLKHHTVFRLSVHEMVPAVGQGALAIETRSGDTQTLDMIRFLNDPPTKLLVDAEREFVRAVGGDCKSAIGSFARYEGEQVNINAFIGNISSMEELRISEICTAENSGIMAANIGKEFLAQGGATILAQNS